MGNVSFTVKPIDVDEFKVHLAIPPENPTMRGFITVKAKVRSKKELKEFGEAIQDDAYEDDIAVLKDMFVDIDGIGNDAGAVTGDAVWEFLKVDKIGAYIVPALIEAYFAQYQSARRGNLKGRRSR